MKHATMTLPGDLARGRVSPEFRQADQPITLFDTRVAVLAARLDLEVWTYDHNFDLMRVAEWR